MMHSLNFYSLLVTASFAIIMTVTVECALVEELVILPREAWHARPPKLVEPMTNPVPYVVIHHSYQPSACHNRDECVKAMQWMQDLHQINNSWNDIGYSFAVGGDGDAYMGRGWSAVGAHSPGYNDKSIGICLIGDWRAELPPANQLRTVRKLIENGIREGKILPNYTLKGHRQVRPGTECPGDRLFAEISNWKHFTPAIEYPKHFKKAQQVKNFPPVDNQASSGASH